MADTTHPQIQATVIPRAEHGISRSNISPNALKVMYRLHGAGFRACLVGGGVRDLLLDSTPKDFDVGTDAAPEEVHRLFRNCRLIGRRFRLAHVHFGPEIIEVATFRAQQPDEPEDSDLAADPGDGDVAGSASMVLSDNVYGTIEEDALRRDFTINALYYDIDDFSVLDFVGGMADLQAGLIRLIGDPELRYREDPVRMLRALRFAAKLGFRIDPDSEAPIHRLGHLLNDVPPARLFDETLKLFLGGHAETTFELLKLYGLLDQLMPLSAQSQRRRPAFRELLKRVCRNTDLRIAEGKPVTPAFLYAALLWGPLCERRELRLQEGWDPQQAFDDAAEAVIQTQVEHTALPRRFSGPMREIWLLQERFHQRGGKRPLRFVEHPRFRAAYDFLLLRAESGEAPDDDTSPPLPELADWWTRFQELSPPQREALALGGKQKKSPRRRRRHNNTAVTAD